jgi:hypothetical protein
MPLWAKLDFAEMRGHWILDYSSHTVLVRGEGIAEFPESITLEVEA